MTITKERIRELAEQAILSMRHSSRHMDWVELGIRVGMAEMREEAATNCAYWASERKRIAEQFPDVPTVRALAADAEAIGHNIRAIRIEGEA